VRLHNHLLCLPVIALVATTMRECKTVESDGTGYNPMFLGIGSDRRSNAGRTPLTNLRTQSSYALPFFFAHQFQPSAVNKNEFAVKPVQNRRPAARQTSLR